MMSTASIRDSLLREVGNLPPVYYSEVLGFVESLKTKKQPTMPETMLLSESVLLRDWDIEEEDNAWASL